MTTYIVKHSLSPTEPGALAADAIAREINRVMRYDDKSTDQAAVQAELVRVTDPGVRAAWGLVVVAQGGAA